VRVYHRNRRSERREKNLMKRQTLQVAWGLMGALAALGLFSFVAGPNSGARSPWAGTAQAANPCNPCAPRRANPCNPCAPRRANPCAPKAANPCNPCAPKGGAQSVSLIEWGRDYTIYQRTTGFVESASHGGRLVVTFVTPKSAADVYRVNAKLVRENKTGGFKRFPVGTVIAKESFLKDDKGGPGQRGPVFFMRKEKAGYDKEGGDWRYAFTQPDFALIAEGNAGDVAFCRSCHLAVKNRDFVYAVDR
jgi:hypothetical protein